MSLHLEMVTAHSGDHLGKLGASSSLFWFLSPIWNSRLMQSRQDAMETGAFANPIRVPTNPKCQRTSWAIVALVAINAALDRWSAHVDGAPAKKVSKAWNGPKGALVQHFVLTLSFLLRRK